MRGLVRQERHLLVGAAREERETVAHTAADRLVICLLPARDETADVGPAEARRHDLRKQVLRVIARLAAPVSPSLQQGEPARDRGRADRNPLFLA